MYAGSAGCPLAMCKAICVVAPIYFLVWYNASIHASASGVVVVPIYFLVWYNTNWYRLLQPVCACLWESFFKLSFIYLF